MQVASILVWFLIVALVSFFYGTSPDVSRTVAQITRENQNLPAAYDFEEVGDCFDSYPNVYCVSKSFIDSDTRLYKAIQATRSPYRFNRTVISHGVCIKRCQDMISSTGSPDALYNESNFGSNGLRAKYQTLVTECVNRKLQPHSGRAKGYIEYCVTNNNGDDESFDLLDATFFAILFGIVLTTICSTLYEFYGGKRLIMRSFSLISNWTTFTRAPESTDHVYLDCLKVVSQTFNISGHLYFLIVSNPHVNSGFFETDRYTAFMKVGLGLNFTNFIFFTVSGYLVMERVVAKVDAGKVFTVKDLLVGLRDRYLRLTPLLAFTILLEATWAEKIFSGPAWQFLSGREKEFCRQNWWTNLLFVNNFVNLERACLLPTWYLANDLQLFILKDIFLIIVSHFRHYKLFLSSIIATSFLVLLQISATFQINGVYTPSLEAARTFTRSDDQFNGFLKPTYTNIGCYFSGILVAFIDFDVKKRKKPQLRDSKFFMFCWNFMKLLLFVLLSASYIFQTYNLHPILRTFSAAAYRFGWSFIVSVTILGFGNGIGGFWKDLMNASGWRRLSKVNYSVLMCHIFTYQLLVGAAMQSGLLQPSYGLLGTMIVLLVGLSYAMAVIFYMLVELPAANVTRVLLGK